MIFVTFRWYAEDADVHSRDSTLEELDYIEFIRRFRFSKPNVSKKKSKPSVHVYVWVGVLGKGLLLGRIRESGLVYLRMLNHSLQG